MRFEGKVAVVTGGGAGIGKATAEGFAREGASVVVVDINPENANAVVQAIQGGGGKAVSVQADVSRDVDAQRIAAEAVQAFGDIDYLCNIAGIQTYGTVVETTEDIWERTIGVNLKSIYLVSKYCIPEIAKRGGGAIVNVSSAQGFASQERVAAYAASKGGAIAMTRTMALDHAPQNIRVNCVCPGAIDTPMLRWGAEHFSPGEDPQKVLQGWGEFHPIGRIGTAEEVAETILFLASDAAGFMTGSALVVDGGLLAKLI
jgi:NAD(P)-dependent dehydrogenase (short-subunit alcohol dehydrogenase family)